MPASGVFVPAQLNDLAVDVSLSSVARGDMLYRGASKWNNLSAGGAGTFLVSGGSGADPSWSRTIQVSSAVVPLTLRGNTSYTGALQEWRDGSNTLQANLNLGGDSGAAILEIGSLRLGNTGSAFIGLADHDDAGLRFDSSSELRLGNDSRGLRMKTSLAGGGTGFSVENISSGYALTEWDTTNALTRFPRPGVFQWIGSSSNNTTQDGLRIQPSTSLATYWRPLAIYADSSATSPRIYVNKDLTFFPLNGIGLGLGNGALIGRSGAGDVNTGIGWAADGSLYLACDDQPVCLRSSGTTCLSITSGTTAIGDGTATRPNGDAQSYFRTGNGSNTVMAVKGHASQAADLFAAFKSDDTKLFSVTASGQVHLPIRGSSSDDTTQDSLRIQPNGTVSTYWRPLAVYLSSGATSPSAYVSKTGRFYTAADFVSADDTKGVILKDSGGHYWRVTVNTSGVLTTSDLGTSLPA